MKALFGDDKAKIEDINGVDRFDFNRNTNTLMVHAFGTNFLLLFKYDQTEKRFEFKDQLNLNDTVDLFARILDNYYLIVSMDEHSEARFCIKKLDDSNQLVDIDQSAQDKKLKSVETILYDNCDLKKLKDFKEEKKEDYLSFFKSKIDNINQYYARKQERIEFIQASKRKNDSKAESVEAKLAK